ncbi:CBS domain-containing protein [Aeromicrobium sp. CF3.5]|uniref:CBS domain-containing protein n=1 Tax=Aeromicrobium sp. CF3.5 TaxID=3373078 RepID=UPI003EE6C1D7
MSSHSTAGDVMMRRPRTLSANASIGEARTVLRDDHLHMVLLTDGTKLVGTVTRSDLPEPAAVGLALRWATLEGRTVGPGTSVASIEQMLVDQGRRRLAVVDADGALLGLMCLKRRGRGFCSDDDVESRLRDCVDAERGR